MLYWSIEENNAFIKIPKSWIVCAILLTIVFSLLIVNSLCIILLFIGWVSEGDLRAKWNVLRKDRLLVAYWLYFLAQLPGLFMAPDIVSGWKAVESKLGFFVLPMIFCSSSFIGEINRRKILLFFCQTLTFASLCCLVFAAWRYAWSGDPRVFFYHDLVSPIHQHAVYFSAFLFIAMLFLLLDAHAAGWFRTHTWLRRLWIAYFVFFILLLASKLVLSLLILCLPAYFVRRNFHRPSGRRIFILVVLGIFLGSLLFLANTPVKNRFSELLNSNKEMYVNRKYRPEQYFNGFEFRMLLWGITYDLLQENHAFLFGFGSSNTQSLLAKKYHDMGMYAGDKSRGDSGYLNYNCHNQFLQICLQSGLPGLAAFLFWIITIFRRAVQAGNDLLSGIILLIFLFFMTESVFERQMGMILCTVFPLILLYPPKSRRPK